MSPETIAASKFAALVVSLTFNIILCAAIARLWKRKEDMQDKVTNLLIELCKELNRYLGNK